MAAQSADEYDTAGVLKADSSLQDIIKLASSGPTAVSEFSKMRWNKLLSIESQTVRSLTGVETIDTASLSKEVRRDLAAKMVDLIKDSLRGGGRFNEKENTVEQFEAAFALPGSRLHCIFDQSGKLLGAASIHLDAFPTQHAHLKTQYAGSLRPGLFRVVTIATELQGTDAYEKLDRRAILDASGKVDFLIGRWRVGKDANEKGSKHIKMGHMPQGWVERTEEGKVFQHLIISVNFYLREVAFKARPKGYLPSEHRAIARQIVDLSS
jgi:hypothetical protein